MFTVDEGNTGIISDKRIYLVAFFLQFFFWKRKERLRFFSRLNWISFCPVWTKKKNCLSAMEFSPFRETWKENPILKLKLGKYFPNLFSFYEFLFFYSLSFSGYFLPLVLGKRTDSRIECQMYSRSYLHISISSMHMGNEPAERRLQDSKPQ